VEQTPAVHVLPVAQAVLQAPQFASSVIQSTQTPLQTFNPVPHVEAVTHVLLEHVFPEPQALAQPPQFKGSFDLFTHFPLQTL